MRFASTCRLTSPKHTRKNEVLPRKHLYGIIQTNSFGYSSSWCACSMSSPRRHLTQQDIAAWSLENRMVEEHHELNCLSSGLVAAQSHSHGAALALITPVSSLSWWVHTHCSHELESLPTQELCPGCLWEVCTSLYSQLWEKGARMTQTKRPSGSRKTTSLGVSHLRHTYPGTKSRSGSKGHTAQVPEQAEW